MRDLLEAIRRNGLDKLNPDLVGRVSLHLASSSREDASDLKREMIALLESHAVDTEAQRLLARHDAPSLEVEEVEEVENEELDEPTHEEVEEVEEVENEELDELQEEPDEEV